MANKIPTVIKMAPAELADHPELLLDYTRWKEDPMTKMVFGMLQDLMKPNANGTDFIMSLASDAGLVGTTLYARQCGAQWMLDSAMAFDNKDEVVPELEATYGEDKIPETE